MTAVRLAVDTFRIAPSKYLNAGIKPWGEVDFLLTQGYDAYRLGICGCGCGQWAEDAHNPDLADEWVVEDGICYARQAVNKWHDNNKDADPATLIAARRRRDGESEKLTAAEEIAAMKRRHGLT